MAYGAATALLGIPLLVLEPRLLLVATVVVPAGVVTLAAARPGTPRELVLSLAHVAQASVLVPAAMLLAGETSTWVLGAATAIAAAEMAGSVLAVRSVIRERDNVTFAVRSVGYHAAITRAPADPCRAHRSDRIDRPRRRCSRRPTHRRPPVTGGSCPGSVAPMHATPPWT